MIAVVVAGDEGGRQHKGEEAMRRIGGVAVGFLCLAFMVLLARNAGCNRRSSADEWQERKALVRKYCRNAQPFKAPGCIGYELPEMDDETLLAAWRLCGWWMNKDTYGDLAAVIVRLYRTHALEQPIDTYLGRSDVSRLFFMAFGWQWRHFGGDEILLGGVYEFIVEENGKLFASPLLDEELAKTEAVKNQLFPLNRENAFHDRLWPPEIFRAKPIPLAEELVNEAQSSGEE